MQLNDWLRTQPYGTMARLAREISIRVGREVSKQLLHAYRTGAATPAADVIKAIRAETMASVTKADWIELARSVGRTNVAARSGRPVRPYRPRAKAPAKSRAGKKPPVAAKRVKAKAKPASTRRRSRRD